MLGRETAAAKAPELDLVCTRSVLRAAWKTSAAGADVDQGDEGIELDGDPGALWHGLHVRPLNAGVILEMPSKALSSSKLGFKGLYLQS